MVPADRIDADDGDLCTATVEPDAAGERIDRYLSHRTGTPRNQVQRWVRDRRVWVDGETVKVSRVVEAGQSIRWRVPPPVGHPEIEPESGELEVLFCDADIVVLDKPADLTVHPGAGRKTGTLVHRLLHRFPEIGDTGGMNRPGIVHRLDKDTTGVMVVARSERAYRSLSRSFAGRLVDKRYLTFAYGIPKTERGVIDRPIGRHPQRRKEMTVRPDGRPARTDYQVLDTTNGISLLDIDLETGRTHQIRVHLKAIGHPVVGDPVYGEARWKGLPARVQAPLKSFPRPALHAWQVRFPHPATGELVAFTAAPAPDLVELWERLGGNELPDAPAPAS